MLNVVVKLPLSSTVAVWVTELSVIETFDPVGESEPAVRLPVNVVVAVP